MGRQDWETETLIPTNGGGFDGAYGFGAQMSVPQVDCDLMQTLGAKNPMAVAFPINTQIAMRHEAMGESTGMGIGTENDPAFTLQSAHSHAVGVCAPSLTAYNMDSRSPQSEEQQRIVGAVYKTSMQVRRLTPRECERLQGFPDDYTLVQHRNKPAADGPRYKALGNSMAVPVMAWIGRRIAMVEQLKGDSRDD
jgi:DNA (cytosine-5)-methyltransferase 1